MQAPGRSASRTGWFWPRFPNWSLVVFAPTASPASWFPRQMPKMGRSALPSRSNAAFRFEMVAVHLRARTRTRSAAEKVFSMILAALVC